MITDPRFAPRRSDLPYLRRRARPRHRAAVPAAQTGPPASPASTPATGARSDAAVADFFSGHGPHHEHPGNRSARPQGPAPAPKPAASPSPRAPVSSSLDLTAPAPAAPTAPAPAVPTAPLAAQPRAAPSTSLDLDAAAAPTPSRSTPPAPEPSPARGRAYPVVRVRPSTRTILNHKSPTLTLSRTQSGIGTLTFEAACSDEVGDLRLGCAYQLTSGQTSTVAASGGNRLAPPRSRRPVLIGGHERYERISVDLRQCREIERLAVYAFSESRAQLSWGGTLIVTTFRGAKVELPLEQLAPGGVAVLLSLYNVAGEFVLRAELETINGSIREACRAYGYDQITWLDDRTPVD